MSQAYCLPPSPSRSTAHETRHIDWNALRVTADHLHELPVPLRVTAPRELDPCGSCLEDWPHDPGYAIGEIVYTTATGRYAEAVCEVHASTEVRWMRRNTPSRTVQHLDIPAPLAHLIDVVNL